jgi:N-acetylglucosaminyl-diphospho-decaprenol L-rhamnosyltransferase
VDEINQRMDATIVIPVHNQLRFTRQCLDSLNAAGYVDAMIVVVNNASTDGTAEFLATRPALRVITNPENRACAAAWNQGFQASTTWWTVFLNNDTVSPPGWLESLIAFAEAHGLAVASPALGEGELDYALNPFAREFAVRMKNVTRRGRASGACFMVARDVFAITGGFDENFTRGGNEDDDFFWRVRAAGLSLAVGGSAYIHHFGSVTRKAVLTEQGAHRAETVGYFRRKWKINWARRRWLRLRRKTLEAWWVWNERLRHGHTLREHRAGGKLFFR